MLANFITKVKDVATNEQDNKTHKWCVAEVVKKEQGDIKAMVASKKQNEIALKDNKENSSVSTKNDFKSMEAKNKSEQAVDSFLIEQYNDVKFGDEKVDILESRIQSLSPELLAVLLKDRTTGKNIIWATDNY